MNRPQCCFLVQIFIVLCLRETNAVTESNFNSFVNVSTTSGEVFSSATPPPGGAAATDRADAGTTEAVTQNSTEAATPNGTGTPDDFTETPLVTTAQPVAPSEGNPNLNPNLLSYWKMARWIKTKSVFTVE